MFAILGGAIALSTLFAQLTFSDHGNVATLGLMLLFQVYTTTMSQLVAHVPEDNLPTSLGGSLHVNHESWMQYCIKCTDSKQKSDYCDVSSFLDNKFNQLAHMDLLSEREASTTSAELPSDASGEILNNIAEKHDSEEREKEVTVEKNGSSILNHVDTVPPSKPLIDKDSIFDSIHRGTSGLTIEEFVEMVRKKGRNGLYQDYGLIRAAETDGTFETSRYILRGV